MGTATGPQPHFDTASIRIVDANAAESAYWKDGTATFACTETVSPDGKSMIEEFTETPASERVTGHATFIRVANGPVNSHALSGSWEMRAVRNVSSTGPLTTYRITKDEMALSAGPEHFDAKFDGKEYPSHNDRQETNQTVSLKLVDGNTIEETTKLSAWPAANPILRRSMRIQHYVHVKIPETILAGCRRSRSRLSAQAAHREVSEFVHAAFLRHGAER